MPVLPLFAGLVLSSLIASSRIEMCVRTGISDQDLTCEKDKFVVALSIENGQNGTETVEAYLREASDDAGTRTLERPWRIELRKSQVIVRYPVVYLKNFNAQPVEDVIITPPLDCKAGGAQAAPTCGWAYSGGVKIVDSQGFCCKCSSEQVFGIGDAITRASSLDCGLFTSKASAHCLRFGERWYSAYEVGAAETYFVLELGITSYHQRANSTGIEERMEYLKIGPGSPGARSADGRIIARLLGDFARNQQAPTLESKYLLVPFGANTDERVKRGPAEWMMLDRSLFTLDGTECNKIGVSYPAFNNEANTCQRYAGSCIGSQIEQFRASDVLRLARGQQPQYMVQAYGDFYYEFFAATGFHYMAYKWSGMQASVVTLEMAADSVRFTTNTARGEIVSATVEGFEAQSRDGRLRVTIKNVGSIISDFSVSVDCAQGAPSIKPILGQRRSVQPSASQDLVFELYSESPLATQSTCVVRLFDSLNAVTDTETAGFTTTETVTNNGAQDGVVVGRGEVSESATGSADATAKRGVTLGGVGGLGAPSLCEARCTGFFDVACFVVLKCWGKFGRLLGLVVGAIVGLVLLRLACMSSAFRAWVGSLCGTGEARAGKVSRAAMRRGNSRVLDADEFGRLGAELARGRAALERGKSHGHGSARSHALTRNLPPAQLSAYAAQYSATDGDAPHVARGAAPPTGGALHGGVTFAPESDACVSDPSSPLPHHHALACASQGV